MGLARQPGRRQSQGPRREVMATGVRVVAMEDNGGRGGQEPDMEGEKTGRAGVSLCTFTCLSLKAIVLEAEAESIVLTGTILWKLKEADLGFVDQSPTGCGLQLITHSQGSSQLLVPKAPQWKGGPLASVWKQGAAHQREVTGKSQAANLAQLAHCGVIPQMP